MRLIYPETLENAPNNGFIKSVITAFCEFDWDFIEASISDDFEMHWPGKEPLKGKEPFMQFMREFDHPKTVLLKLESMVSSDKDIATYGKMETLDGTKYFFADFYHLTGAESNKLRKIVSLVIEHD